MAVHVVGVTPMKNDVLLVEGYVDGHPIVAKGWTSWTRQYWTEQPPDPVLHDAMSHDEREAAMQAHRDACEAARRPMTAQELRNYCVDLLLEAFGGGAAEGLHVEPILDVYPEPEPEPEAEPADEAPADE